MIAIGDALESDTDVLWEIQKAAFLPIYEQLHDGIFYRLAGDSLCGMFGAGEYYLVRIYIRPDRQSCGIGRQAILLCEKSMTR